MHSFGASRAPRLPVSSPPRDDAFLAPAIATPSDLRTAGVYEYTRQTWLHRVVNTALREHEEGKVGLAPYEGESVPSGVALLL